MIWVFGLYVLLSCVGRTSAFCQENYGLRSSNYGGINAVRLNPSSTINSKFLLDVNLVSGSLFIENNFLYIHKKDYSIFNFVRKNPKWPVIGVEGEGLDYYRDIEKVNGFEMIQVSGPSLAMTFGRHAFGIFTNAVSMTSVNDLPKSLAILLYEGLEYDSLHGIPNVNSSHRSASLAWWEAGLNYSTVVHQFYKNKVSVGINIRRLFGYGGAYLDSKEALYTIENDSTLDIESLDTEAGFAFPMDFETNEYPVDGRLFNGRGVGIDLGITYMRTRDLPAGVIPKRNCEYDYEDYVYKVGFSLLDIGKVSFPDNGQVHSFEDVSAYWEHVDTVGFYNIDHLLEEFSEVLYGDPNASYQSGAVNIGLPAAASVQADFQYYPGWYINSTVVLPLPLWKEQIRRPSQAVIALRYESPRYEFNLPVSFYNFSKPRIGLYSRFYYFGLGTENLAGLFGFKDVTGIDIYFSLKYNIQKGWCTRYKPKCDCRHLEF